MSAPAEPRPSRPIRFVHRGAVQEVSGLPATTTVLRSDFGLGAYAPFISDEVQIQISFEAMATECPDAVTGPGEVRRTASATNATGRASTSPAAIAPRNATGQSQPSSISTSNHIMCFGRNRSCHLGSCLF